MPLAPPPPPLYVSSRPFGVAALALALGIAIAEAWPGLQADAVLGGVAVLFGAAGLYTVAVRSRMVSLQALVLAVAVLGGLAGLGAARLAAFRTPPSDSLGPAAHTATALSDTVRGRDRDTTTAITVWARVASVPTASDWSIRFLADVDSAARQSIHGLVSGRVQVGLSLPQDNPYTGRPAEPPVYPLLRLGDRVRLTGRLAAPPDRRNPADFDYGAYLRRQGVVATLRVESEADAVFLAPTRHPLDLVVLAVQRHVREATARYVPGVEAQAVVLALLVADWSGIDDPTVAAFRDTGLLHLLSVSGLHLVFVGLALYALLGPLLGRLGIARRRAEWTRTAITLTVMFVYTVATGSSVPVVRAFVMAAALVVGRAVERRVDTLNSLGLAAVGLLLWRPTALFEAGFQLSFAAVAALVVCTPVVTGWLPESFRREGWRGTLTGSVVASVVATVATAPILLAWFGSVPVSGVLLNLPAIPLTSAALGGGLAASACAGWWPTGAGLFGAFAAACVRLLLVVSRWGAAHLGSFTFSTTTPGPLVLAALAALVLSVAFWARPRLRARLGLASVALVALSGWAGALAGTSKPVLDAVFLDVGQGDACLLRLPSGQTVLIDAGDRTSRRDEGLRTVVPHLVRTGIRRIDALVLTHPHADHIGGAVSVMRAVQVGRLVTNGQADSTAMWTETRHVADSLGIPVQSVRAGDTLGLDPAVRVRVLGPSRELVTTGGANEASVVLLIEYGTTRWLFAGDAETAAETELVTRYARLLRADVVKVGHHGSRTSSTAPFVAAVAGAPSALRTAPEGSSTGPRFAIVSVARLNRHGLPDEEPVHRWHASGLMVLQTADEGALWLRSDGSRVERVDWRRRGR